MFSLSLPSPSSLITLGKAYAKILLRKMLSDRSQLPTFLEYYQRDGMVLFEPQDALVLQGAAKCFACGQCDAQALMDDSYTMVGREGPMAFVLGVSRHSGHHDAATFSSDLTDKTLQQWTEVCPVSVPFVPLVALVRRRAEALSKARSESAIATVT